MKYKTKICLLLCLAFGFNKIALADDLALSSETQSTVASANDDNDRKAQEAKQEEQRKQEEAKKAEEEQRKQDEAKRAQDEQRKQDEAKRAEEEQRKQDDAKKAEEEQRKLVEAKKIVHEQRRQDEMRQKEQRRQEAFELRHQGETKPAALELRHQYDDRRADEQRQIREARIAELKKRVEVMKDRARSTPPRQEIQIGNQRREEVVIERSKTYETKVYPPKERVIVTEIKREPVPVVTPVPRVVVEPSRTYISTTVIKPVPVAPSATVVTIKNDSNDYQRFRERELKERELRLRELELRSREQQLTEKEKAFNDQQWYVRYLQKRDWQDMIARDQELRYLMWREQQLTPITWYYRGQICRYVTTYRKGIRVNKRVTICKYRNGVKVCYHPTRYYIYPVTRVVCYYPRRVRTAIIY